MAQLTGARMSLAAVDSSDSLLSCKTPSPYTTPLYPLGKGAHPFRPIVLFFLAPMIILLLLSILINSAL